MTELKAKKMYVEDLYKKLSEAADVLEHYDNDEMVQEMLREIRILFSAIQNQIDGDES